jgi:hypothetical protein
MYLVHAPLGYIANEVLQKNRINKLKTHEQILVAVFSICWGIFPDFDIFLSSIPSFIHHNIITHTPVLYIGIWAILKILINPVHKLLNKKITKVLDKNLLNILVDTFLVGTISHILADTLVSSIMLFYPLSDVKIHVLKYVLEPNLFAGYSLSALFAVEVMIFAIFIYFIYGKFFKKCKLGDILTKVLIVISVIYFLFSIFISINTYNRNYMYDESGEVNHDVDYDRLLDSMDMDIGNDGTSNIMKANIKDVLDSTLDIINSKKWSVYGENSLTSNLKEKFGGLDSYRVISQAYYNIHLPIEPVLKDYAIKRDGFESYTKEYQYTEILLDYLLENELLIELNLNGQPNISPSKMFFLINSDNVIINLGITLEGNYTAIVLDTDKSLQMHSYQEIREKYAEDIVKIYIQK